MSPAIALKTRRALSGKRRPLAASMAVVRADRQRKAGLLELVSRPSFPRDNALRFVSSSTFGELGFYCYYWKSLLITVGNKGKDSVP